MNKRNLYTPVVALLLGISAVGLTTMLAQRGQHDGSVKASPSGGPQEGSAGSPQEGIKVHGHWTIKVRNPDGTLVTRREFENALIASTVLPSILARQSSVGHWTVQLSRITGSPFACGANACRISEAGSGLTAAANVFKNLTLTPSTSKLTLSGNATASANSEVNVVNTGLLTCNATVAPASPCTSTTAFGNAMTQKTLSPGIPVQAGQQIQVTVEISFS